MIPENRYKMKIYSSCSVQVHRTMTALARCVQILAPVSCCFQSCNHFHLIFELNFSAISLVEWIEKLVTIRMGELPVFTCQAHVFTINPETKKSWIPSSSKAVDINFFYDSNKHCYRIISVEDGPGGKKVIINSTLTEKMTFKKTSQKFGQWADSRTGAVHGLGFNSETELTEFLSHFKQYVEASKLSPTATNGSSGRNIPDSMFHDSGSLMMAPPSHTLSPILTNPHTDRFSPATLTTMAPIGYPNNNNPTSGPSPPSSLSHPTPPLLSHGSPPGLSDAGSISASLTHQIYGGTAQSMLHLQQQLKQAQAQVRRLEGELTSSKRQAVAASVMSPAAVAGQLGNFSFTGSEFPPDVADSDSVELRDCMSRLDVNGSTTPGLNGPTVSGDEWNGTAESPAAFTHPRLSIKTTGAQPPSNNSAANRIVWSDRNVAETVRQLYTRLGFVLREAVDLHSRLGALLPPYATTGPVPPPPAE